MEVQFKAGIQALLLCKQKMKRELLLDSDLKVMLQISAIKVAPGAIKQTIKIPLPAPCVDSTEACLFVKDLKRGIRVDHEKSQRHWREVLDDAGVTRVAEVMPLRQLKAEYKMFEARRKLCDAYDVFLSDVRIARLLPALLGKHFIGKKKQAVSINMEATDLAAEIDSALNATYLHLYNSGDSSSVQVGRSGQTAEQLLQNVLSAVEVLRLKFPGGLHNIRSLHLKLDKSPAVPIYVSTVSANSVPVPATRYQPGSRRQPVTGELSTARAESDVVVTRHGDVQVLQKRPLSDDEELTDEEELANAARARRGKKRTRLPPRNAPPAAETTPAEGETAEAPDAEDSGEEGEEAGGDDGEDGGESSDEEERQMAAHERRFLDQMEAQQQQEGKQQGKSAGKQQVKEEGKQEGGKPAKGRTAPGRSPRMKAKKPTTETKPAAKAVAVTKPGKAAKKDNSAAAKSYSKKKVKGMGKVRKVK